jgi:hypothetical protein
MTDPDPTPNPWPETLERLRGQMARATFETWLQGTVATADGDTLTVHVKNTYAEAWLKERLHETISRTVAGVAGREIEVRYEIGGGPESEPEQRGRPAPGPGEISVSLVSFDPTHWGRVSTQRYALMFWQPLLGAFPFQTWVTLRMFAWNSETEGWPSIQLLADICANGNRHRLLGRAEQANRAAQVGALEILTQARIIHIRTEGKGRKTRYYFRVLDNLPLLAPRQVEELSPRLQQRHKEWLWKCSIDYEEWQQLDFGSLIEPED